MLYRKFQMTYLGLVTTGGQTVTGVPEIFSKEVVCSLQCPHDGVDVVFANRTHLIEIREGLVLRSCRLPGGIGDIVMIRIIFGLVKANSWNYLLQGNCGHVVFVSGDTFAIGPRQYKHVEDVVVGDFFDTGQRLACINMGLADYVLTDGNVELDVNEKWPPSSRRNDSVDNALEKRLKAIHETTSKARVELDVTTQQLQQAVIGLSGRLMPSSVYEHEKSKSTKLPLRQLGHWWRLVNKTIVLGLNLEITDAISNIALQLTIKSDYEVCYSNSLVQLTKVNHSIIQPVQVMDCIGMASETQLATMIVCFPVNDLLCVANDTISLIIGYTFTSDKDDVPIQIESTTISVAVSQFYSANSTLVPTFSDSVAAEITLLAMFMVGVHETVIISTKYGSLCNFSTMLESIGLNFVASLQGSFVTSVNHPLHLAGLLFSEKSAQRVVAIMYAKDYAQLMLLVKMIRSCLPADTVIVSP